MYGPETKILVVDDFATMRKIIKKVLKELGYNNVEEADDGKTALPLLKTASSNGAPFQLIISDWNMPGMPGIELLKNVKADAELKSTPFMMVTAESEQANIIEAAKQGVADYVVKPFNAATLKTKLENIYKKHAA